MTVEQIELRKILTQMLADNGINRETIKGFVEEIVSEKVDRAIDRIIHETNMDSETSRHNDLSKRVDMKKATNGHITSVTST